MTVTHGPDLVRAVATALTSGPVHTLALADQVLGLTGNSGAAAAAVFSLLGSDARFGVDSEGCWSYAGPPLGASLSALRYAVVDVETTGGAYSNGHRITDIAICEVERGVVVAEYKSLVNPGRSIPGRIVALTGISDAMVAGAPFFDEISESVAARLQGRVFVAHNVSFDWGFVSRSLQDAMGDVPGVERLCTVRMARRLVPELQQRNLDAVTRHFGIEIADRHRAWGDALATAQVLLRLIDEAEGQGLTDLEALRSYLKRSPRKRAASARAQLELLRTVTES